MRGGERMSDDVITYVGGVLRDEVSFDSEPADDRFDAVEERLLYLVGESEPEHIIPEHTPISNQGAMGSCVANAIIDAFEIISGLENGEVQQFSRLFLYWAARCIHGGQHLDGGTYVRAGFHQLKKIGVVRENFFPYKKENVLKAPELDLYTMASNNRIDGFYRISSNGDKMIYQIETAIRANHPVVFAMNVDRTFTEYRGGDVVFSEMDGSIGGHAMILVGVRSGNKGKEFLVRNSWSERWGDKGHCWMTAGLISDRAGDIWVGTKSV